MRRPLVLHSTGMPNTSNIMDLSQGSITTIASKSSPSILTCFILHGIPGEKKYAQVYNTHRKMLIIQRKECVKLHVYVYVISIFIFISVYHIFNMLLEKVTILQISITSRQTSCVIWTPKL